MASGSPGWDSDIRVLRRFPKPREMFQEERETSILSTLSSDPPTWYVVQKRMFNLWWLRFPGIK